jgi:hypothetical protein
MSVSQVTGGPAPGPTQITATGYSGLLPTSLIINQQQGVIAGGVSTSGLSILESTNATYQDPANEVQTEFVAYTPNAPSGLGAEGALYIKQGNGAITSTIAYSPKPTGNIGGDDGSKGFYLPGLSQSGVVVTAQVGGIGPFVAPIPVQGLTNASIIMLSSRSQAGGVISWDDTGVAPYPCVIESAAAATVQWFVVAP